MPIQSGSHNYGLSDIKSMFNDALYGNRGILPNLSFMPPRDPSEYDDISWQARVNQQELFEQFLDQTVGQAANRRAAAMSSALGLGQAGMSVFRAAMGIDPRTALSAIGHFGGADAARTILSMGNSMAYARGAGMGGVLDPSTLIQNTNFAAVQGGMAYANNFNLDGSINAEQTRGLSLPTVGYVIGRTLSDRSSYTAWADRIRRGQGLTAAEQSLTENDIQAFMAGESLDPKKFEAASNSFNEDIKKMTRELNGLIASVSKMTGSCDEAIRFLESYTNGNLTSSTESARKARTSAAKLAANIRVTASDAGISPEYVYGLAGRFQATTMPALAAYDQKAMRLGASRLFAGTAGLGALSFAEWAKANPGANREQVDQAQTAIELQLKGYNDSGMYSLNMLAAKLKHMRPDLDMSEYEDMLKRGSASGAKDWLIARAGRQNVMKFMSDPREAQLAALNPEINAEAQRFRRISIGHGQAAEARRVAQYREFMGTIDFAVSAAAGNDEEKLRQIGDTRELYKGQLLSDQVLKTAGVSDTAAFRKKYGDLSFIEIQTELSKKANGDKAIALAQANLGEQVSSSIGRFDSGAAEGLRRSLARQGGGRVTEDDILAARNQIALERERDDIDRLKADAFSGSRESMNKLLSRGGSRLSGNVLDKMNVYLSEQLAKVGGKTSPETLQLDKKEMADVRRRVAEEMSKEGNTRTFEEVSRDVLQEKYSNKLLESEDLLDSVDLIDHTGKLSEKALASFGDSFLRYSKSEILKYDFTGKQASGKYVKSVKDEDAYARARRNKDLKNSESARSTLAYAGGNLGDMLQQQKGFDVADAMRTAGDKLNGSGAGELAVAVADDSGLESAKRSTSMPLSEADKSGFKQLTEDVEKKAKIASGIESELNKGGSKWQSELKKAVASGDEESVKKILGSSKEFGNLKDLGMSALEAGKIVSAGIDSQDQSRKDAARQDAILEQRASGKGSNDEIAQILLKILNLIQGAVK